MDGGGQNIYGRRICQKGSLAHNRDVCPALLDRPRFNNCPGFDSHTQGPIATNTNTNTNTDTNTDTDTNTNTDTKMDTDTNTKYISIIV